MILTDEQAIKITKDNPNGKAIKFFQGKYEVMRAHVTGIGAGKLIERIEGFERENITKARRKMMLSNKDLIYRVMKPRDKIYTAKGGIESFNLSTTELIQDYKEYLSICAGRLSLKEYIKKHLQKAFDIDPMGLKWVAINDAGEPYPTYKSIMGIYDYEIADGTPEYVIFKSTPKEIQQYIAAGIIKGLDAVKVSGRVYRCVCDGWDRIIIWISSAEPVIVEAIPNVFGKVQGQVVSDIPCEDEEGNLYYESCLNPVGELLSQYIFGRSIYNIAFSQVAYPIMWMQAQTCPTCQGKGNIGVSMDGSVPTPQQAEMKCPECKGTGKYPHIQNSDTYIWEFRNDVDKSVPRPPLGMIETAIGNLQYMKDNNYSNEDMINMTMWGVVKVQPNAKMPGDKSKPGNNTSETAFEADLNEEPKRDKQKEFSRWGGNSYKWYADTCGKLKYGDSYISSAILWGDRYANESPDEILTRITKAKAALAPQSVLQSLYLEYLDTKYENNPLEWRKYWLMYLGEPYFFFAVSEVMTWANIPQIQILEKQLWGEFMCTLTDQIIASIPDENPVPILQKMIRDYVTKKYVDDKKYDALLFAGDGSMLAVGDNARVKLQLAQDPKHLGQTFKVAGINKDSGEVMLQADGLELSYQADALERIF